MQSFQPDQAVATSQPHHAPVIRNVWQMSETDDGCRRSVLSLLRLVRRPMSIKEMSQACCITERKLRTLMVELQAQMEVSAVPACDDGRDGFRATAVAAGYRQ